MVASALWRGDGCRGLDSWGLGVLDPILFGQALRLRWLLLQHTEADCCWSTLNADSDTSGFFRASTRWHVGGGATILIWSNNWLEGKGL
jgi:hypothetical protein